MNEAQLHLALNHLPIIIPITGLILMFIGLLVKSEVVKRSAYFFFILAALSAVVASFTGEGAEEIVEELQGVDEKLIKAHEEIAEVFAISLYLLGGLSLVGFWTSWKKKSYAKTFVLLTIGLSLVVLFYAKQTGTSGGEIRHPEIRDNQEIPIPAIEPSSDYSEYDDED